MPAISNDPAHTDTSIMFRKNGGDSSGILRSLKVPTDLEKERILTHTLRQVPSTKKVALLRNLSQIHDDPLAKSDDTTLTDDSADVSSFSLPGDMDHKKRECKSDRREQKSSCRRRSFLEPDYERVKGGRLQGADLQEDGYPFTNPTHGVESRSVRTRAHRVRGASDPSRSQCVGRAVWDGRLAAFRGGGLLLLQG